MGDETRIPMVGRGVVDKRRCFSFYLKGDVVNMAIFDVFNMAIFTL
jgi:hypothetical protein